MVRFWDASALVPLLVEEATTSVMREWYARDEELAVWWATEVECISAIARRRGTTALDSNAVLAGLTRLARLADVWTEMAPTQTIRETAIRLLRTHDLRAADGLQLAAAFAASEGRPSTLTFVSLDARLNEVAVREGFRLLDLAT